MKTVIILAAHGTFPKDFPRSELAEYMSLNARLEQGAVSHSVTLEQRYDELGAKLRSWPRNAENDQFFAASHNWPTL